MDMAANAQIDGLNLVGGHTNSGSAVLNMRAGSAKNSIFSKGVVSRYTTTVHSGAVNAAGDIDGCLIENNTILPDTDSEIRASYGAGVATSGLLTNSVIRNNYNAGRGTGNCQGGGVKLGGTMRNCLVYNNTAGRGAGVYVNNSNSKAISIEYCTIVNNLSTTDAGGVYFYGRRNTGDAVTAGNGKGINNSIVWGNAAPANVPLTANIFSQANASNGIDHTSNILIGSVAYDGRSSIGGEKAWQKTTDAAVLKLDLPNSGVFNKPTTKVGYIADVTTWDCDWSLTESVDLTIGVKLSAEAEEFADINGIARPNSKQVLGAMMPFTKAPTFEAAGEEQEVIVAVVEEGAVVGAVTFQIGNYTEAGTLTPSAIFANGPADLVGTAQAEFKMHGQTWYFVGMPFDVATITVGGAPAIFGENILVREYDTRARATSEEEYIAGAPGDYVDVSLTELKRGKGYIVAVNVQEEVAVRFTATLETQRELLKQDQPLESSIRSTEGEILSNQGWNLITLPFATPVIVDETIQPEFAGLHEYRLVDGKEEFEFIPNGGILHPFKAYFTQVGGEDGEGAISFNHEWRINPVSTMSSAHSSAIQLNVTSASGNDKLYLKSNERANEQYQIGVDVAKLFGNNASKPQFTVRLGNDQLVSRGYSEEILTRGVAVTLKAGSTGRHKIELANRFIDGVTSLYIENGTGNPIDLMQEALELDGHAGTTYHFTLYADMKPLSNPELEQAVRVYGSQGSIVIEGYSGSEQLRCYTIDGQLASQLEANGSERYTMTLQPGVYILRMGTESYKVAVK